VHNNLRVATWLGINSYFPTSRFKGIEPTGPAPDSNPWYYLQLISRLIGFTKLFTIKHGLDSSEYLHVDVLGMSWNLASAVVAVFQTLYASFTLYET